MTLQCHSHPPFTSFRLTKRNGTPGPELQRDHISTCTVSPVTPAHAGSYRCFGHHSHSSDWSASGNAPVIVVTGRRHPVQPMTTLCSPSQMPMEPRVHAAFPVRENLRGRACSESAETGV